LLSSVVGLDYLSVIRSSELWWLTHKRTSRSYSVPANHLCEGANKS
jgi:hypothetical protein